jgi:hypothetical protein
MRSVIGDILPFAVVVTVSPVNIIAAILLLFSKRAVINATSYLVGFVVGVAALLGGITAVAGAINLSAGSDRSRGASALLLVVGAYLVVVAARKFRHRPGPDQDAVLPRWMDGIEGFAPGKSLVVGLAVGVLNPKNIAVGLAAAVAIASAGLPVGQQIGVIAIYVVIASLGVAAPLVTVLVLGQRSKGVLDGWKAWLARNNATMLAVIFLLFGVILIGKGIGGV